RVYHGDSVVRDEPEFSVDGSDGVRGESCAALGGQASNTVGGAKDRHSNRRVRRRSLVRRRRPGIQFGSCDADQSAGRVKPPRIQVIVDDPVDAVAGQSAPGIERRDAAVPDAAQAAFGGSPDRSVRIDEKMTYAPLAQPVARSVRGKDPTIDEMHDASRDEAEPNATVQR